MLKLRFEDTVTRSVRKILRAMLILGYIFLKYWYLCNTLSRSNGVNDLHLPHVLIPNVSFFTLRFTGKSLFQLGLYCYIFYYVNIRLFRKYLIILTNPFIIITIRSFRNILQNYINFLYIYTECRNRTLS